MTLSKNNFTTKLLLSLLILSISLCLRIWRLDEVPASLAGDELAFSYNAYSLWKTGTDEYGVSWPLSFKSFGDFKVPLPGYLQILPVAMGGLNEWSIRLPTAIIAALSPFLLFWLVLEIFRYSDWVRNMKAAAHRGILSKYFTFDIEVSFWSALFLAISPWHLHFSRGAWDASLAVTFTLVGTLLLFHGKRNKWYFFLAAIPFSLAMYSYHAPRVYVPLIIFSWLAIENFASIRNFTYQGFRPLISKLTNPLIFFTLFTLISLPAFISLTNISGNARFVSSSIGQFWQKPSFLIPLEDASLDTSFYQRLPLRAYLFFNDITAKFFAYFSPAQIFVWGDEVQRHSLPDMGRLLLPDLILLLLSLIYLLTKPLTKFKAFLILWLIIGSIPGSITQDQYHSIRSLMMSVPLAIFLSLGLHNLVFLTPKKLKTPTTFFALSAYGVFFITYLANYHYVGAVERAEFFQYGMKQVVIEISPVADQYDQIIIDAPIMYGHPYIHILSHLQYDPTKFHQTVRRGDNITIFPPVAEVYGFDKYTFRSIYWPTDQQIHNTIFVGSPLGLPNAQEAEGNPNIKFIQDIYYPTGQVAMRIVAVN